MTECLKCGYKWNATNKTKKCPGCGSTNWDEPATCNLSGGNCDICGCHFITGLLQAKHCPNCGTKRWNHIETDRSRRLEEVHPWVMEKAKGDKIYHYWMASWREGGKVRNVHLGSCRKVDRETALQKARKAKAGALGIKRSK